MSDNGGRPAKRPRETPVTIDELLEEARIIWRRDHKVLAESTEDRNFLAFFGCSPSTAMILWDLLDEHSLLPAEGTAKHFLWCLMWMEIYGKNEEMTALCGGIDVKTMMKWVIKFVYAIAYLEPEIVRVQCCPFVSAFFLVMAANFAY
jgi:hypothetical protein